MKQEKVINPEGNEVIILKGPIPFNKEIKKEIEDNWNNYAGMEINNPDFTDGNWYYTEVINVIDGPNNIGEKLWYHEAELY